MARLGIISDTHGLLRPEALRFLGDCERILHAGDICDASVLDALSAIAPVIAVRGNNDRGAWADALAEATQFDFHGVRIHAIHDVARLAITSGADGGRSALAANLLVCGHSHKPTLFERDDQVHLNPGSAGPRRFRLPISMAELIVHDGRREIRVVDLDNADAVLFEHRA